jgi:glycosyltransferase involved in cell wall biosynthesis
LKEREILFVGRIHPEKGVHLLIEAMTALAQQGLGGWRLVVIGPSETRFGGGGERYRQQLVRLALPIADRLDWKGAVFDGKLLADAYQRAAIFVYPSLADRGETFGLAPLEAMAHGCVPLVSNLQCFREYVEADVSGRVFDHRARDPVKELAQRLSDLINDAPLRDKMSAAAARRAKDFTIERVADSYLEDFGSIVERGSVPNRPVSVEPAGLL